MGTHQAHACIAPLHIELTASPDLPITETTMRRLKQANADFDAWERYWDRVLGDRFGKGRGDFFRESLIIQRQYAELFVNSQLLRGIKEPTDVVNMPEEKRALAIRAMRNAQKCIEICLQGENVSGTHKSISLLDHLLIFTVSKWSAIRRSLYARLRGVRGFFLDTYCAPLPARIELEENGEGRGRAGQRFV